MTAICIYLVADGIPCESAESMAVSTYKESVLTSQLCSIQYHNTGDVKKRKYLSIVDHCQSYCMAEGLKCGSLKVWSTHKVLFQNLHKQPFHNLYMELCILYSVSLIIGNLCFRK